jgi:hypothetical protein
MIDRCAICGCELNRLPNVYAQPSIEGRSHATKHHYVPERFFGRSNNRKGEKREGIFEIDPWGLEGAVEEFCYDCHEELLHNPILLPEDVKGFKELVNLRGLGEKNKNDNRDKLAKRIVLFHEVIRSGLNQMLSNERK